MSISYYLLFFFLCFFLHACNARHLGAATDHKKLGKIFHSSNKNAEKGIDKIPVLPKTMSSSSNEFGETREDRFKESSLADKTEDQKLKKTKASQKITSNDETDKTSGSVQARESMVSVSWPVPRNKRDEKHPGFNSDYSPPKTHPPSHN